MKQTFMNVSSLSVELPGKLFLKQKLIPLTTKTAGFHKRQILLWRKRKEPFGCKVSAHIAPPPWQFFCWKS